jgi:hypothetical protein
MIRDVVRCVRSSKQCEQRRRRSCRTTKQEPDEEKEKEQGQADSVNFGMFARDDGEQKTHS